MGKSIRFKMIFVLLCAVLSMSCGGSDETDVESEESGDAEIEAPTPSANQPPKISRTWFDPKTPVPGGVLRVKTNVSDPDGDSVKLSYAWQLNGRPITGGSDLINLENVKRGDRLEVTVSASDGKSTSKAKTLSVTLGNQAPEVQSIRIGFSDGGAAQSGVVVATPSATDADGDELTFSYSWSAGGRDVSEAAGETFDSSPYKRGDTFQVTVIANDGQLDSEPLTSDLIELPNRPPRITSTPPNINAQGEFRYFVKSEDPDGDQLIRYSLGQGPEGMTVDSVSGEVVWKPSAKQAGTHSIVIGVKDDLGSVALQEFRLDIKLAQAPTASADGSSTGTAPAEGTSSGATPAEGSSTGAAPAEGSSKKQATPAPEEDGEESPAKASKKPAVVEDSDEDEDAPANQPEPEEEPEEE